jgi:lysozyme
MRLAKHQTYFEGLELRMYKCPAGFNTIGIGHNLDVNPISEEAAVRIYQDDIKRVYEGVVKVLPWFLDLDEQRKFVILDMAFNIGVFGLMKFKKMLAAVRAGQHRDAAAHMRDSKWYKQVPKRAEALIKEMEK